jgi:4-carboxymuconolactone decarboxylase
MFVAGVGLLMLGAVVYSQAPSAAQPGLTAEQLRSAVSRIRSNRIIVPNDYDRLSGEQQAYVRSVLSGPRGDISAPLAVMMVSPGLGDLSQKAMAYARFSGREGFASLPVKLNELAILVAAKHWSSNYVWNAHHRYAVQNGLPQEVVDAVYAGRRPPRMDADVQAVYDFSTELLTTKRVSDRTLQAARAALGSDRGIVDLVGTLGLYQLTAMMTVVDQSPLPQGVKPFFE